MLLREMLLEEERTSRLHLLLPCLLLRQQHHLEVFLYASFLYASFLYSSFPDQVI
jgi:hypothetical protein